MSYLSNLYLFTYNGVQHMCFCFVFLPPMLFQFLWIVHLCCPLVFSNVSLLLSTYVLYCILSYVFLYSNTVRVLISEKG